MRMTNKTRCLESVPVKNMVKYLTHKGRSKKTIESYSGAVVRFLLQSDERPSRIGSKHIQAYIDTKPWKSPSGQNRVISALKCFFYYGLERDRLDINFVRSLKKKSIPRIVSHSKLINQLSAIKNIKHKALLTLIYGTGMRIGEVLALTCDCIRSEEDLMIIEIRDGKNGNYRNVKMSKYVLALLREYAKKHKPINAGFLFYGESKFKAYSYSSANEISKKYIGSNLHSIRHSYATQYLRQGGNLRYLQHQLGHKQLKTTEIYTHVDLSVIQKSVTPI